MPRTITVESAAPTELRVFFQEDGEVIATVNYTRRDADGNEQGNAHVVVPLDANGRRTLRRFIAGHVQPFINATEGLEEEQPDAGQE